MDCLNAISILNLHPSGSNMLVVRERRKLFCGRIVGVIIPEDEAIPHSIVVAVFNHLDPRLNDEELLQIKLGVIDKADGASNEAS